VKTVITAELIVRTIGSLAKNATAVYASTSQARLNTLPQFPFCEARIRNSEFFERDSESNSLSLNDQRFGFLAAISTSVGGTYETAATERRKVGMVRVAGRRQRPLPAVLFLASSHHFQQ
jgi:hypothetical protein